MGGVEYFYYGIARGLATHQLECSSSALGTLGIGGAITILTIGRNMAPTVGELRTGESFRARKHLDHHSDRHKNPFSVLERVRHGVYVPLR